MKTKRVLKRVSAGRVCAVRVPYPTVNPPRARKVITRRTNRVIGLFTSLKNRALVPWESQLEFDCLRLLEVDNTVALFSAQPEVLQYELGGDEHRYYPDLRVDYRDGRTEIVEVKFEADAVEPANQARFEVVAEIYKKRGIGFRLMTERDIRREPLLENARLMLEARDLSPSPRLKLQVADSFNKKRPRTLSELEASLSFKPEQRGELYAMALQNFFDIDLTTAPLSGDSLITSDFKYANLGE